MTAAAPLWLLLLLPWGTLVLYLLTGTRQKTFVPFLDLWKSDQARPRRRRFQFPPIAIVFALLALLLAILAAARLGIAGQARWKIVMLVDRGYTMSSRYASLQQQTGIHADETQYLPAASKSAIDTRPLLRPAIDDALRDPAAIVLLFSDQKVNRSDARLIQVSPPPIENIGIIDLQIRITPHPQAMVRLLNDSSKTHALLTLTAATQPVTLDLPTRPGERNYFLDLSSAPPIIHAHIDPGLGIDSDDDFYTVRRQSWPKIELRVPTDDALRRMVDVYQRNRPGDDLSPILPILASPDANPGVVVPPLDGVVHPLGHTQLITAEDHPVTTGINWPAIPSDATTIDPPTSDWHVLVKSGDQPLVAIRQAPARQVWIGFRSPTWSATPDYVIFWTKVFDWAGQGSDEYSWNAVRFPDHLWPGLYSRGKDQLAINAPATPLDPAPPFDWRQQLSSAQSSHPPGASDLSRWLLFVALGLLALSIIVWPRHNLGH